MPSYILSPFKPTPRLLVAGTPSYVWGSYNDKTGPTQGIVLQSLGIGTTLELIVKILSGNVPVVGALLTVVGVSASNNFNVTNVALTAVDTYPHGNIPDNGMYALAYTTTSTVSPLQADAGQFIVPQPEVAETLVTDFKSAPVAMPFNMLLGNMHQAITVVVSFPTLPTSIIVYLQQAVQDIDSEYATVATVVTVAGSAVTGGGQITIDPTLGRFFRLSSGDMVGNGTIIAKILI
jgi:hypothetical protein